MGGIGHEVSVSIKKRAGKVESLLYIDADRGSLQLDQDKSTNNLKDGNYSYGSPHLLSDAHKAVAENAQVNGVEMSSNLLLVRRLERYLNIARRCDDRNT